MLPTASVSPTTFAPFRGESAAAAIQKQQPCWKQLAQLAGRFHGGFCPRGVSERKKCEECSSPEQGDSSDTTS